MRVMDQEQAVNPRRYFAHYGLLTRGKDGQSHRTGGFVVLAAESKEAARAAMWQRLCQHEAIQSHLPSLEKIEIYAVKHRPETQALPEGTLLLPHAHEEETV